MSLKTTWLIVSEHSMHCAGCVQTLEYALSQLDGLEQVKADWKTQQIKVTMSDAKLSEAVVSELASLGYRVKALEHDSTNN